MAGGKRGAILERYAHPIVQITMLPPSQDAEQVHQQGKRFKRLTRILVGVRVHDSLKTYRMHATVVTVVLMAVSLGLFVMMEVLLNQHIREVLRE
jgi:hypothetical protein